MTGDVYRLIVNGEQHEVVTNPGTTLLAVLREDLELRGAKEACGRGECGACTVLHGDQAVAACVFLIDLVTEPIRTIEGLAEDSLEFREQLAATGGFQCGFCTPGHVVRAMALDWSRIQDEADLRREMSGNICRCTGYLGIVEAMLMTYRQEESTPVGADPEKDPG